MRFPGRRTTAFGSICFALAFLLAGSQIPVLPRSDAVDPRSSPSDLSERLVFHVEWNPPWYAFLLPPMDVGAATLSLAGETQYGGKKARKITFTARSSGALAKFLGRNIDDSYEFLSDSETFCTYYVSKREREGRRMRDIDITYLPDAHQVHIREVDVSTVVPRVLRDKTYDDIPSCVKDPFSALYFIRQTDVVAGSSRRVLVGEDERVKEAEIKVGKMERVHTPAGDFPALPVNTVGVFGGLFKNSGQFSIWLSADGRRMPVKFEARMSVGKVTGSLVEARY